MNSTIQHHILNRAEQLSEQCNIRVALQRLEVLRLISQRNGDISAYDLLDLLRKLEQ